MPMTIDRTINSSVHCQPIKLIIMMVSDREFQGLAIKNAINWPMLAPLS